MKWKVQKSNIHGNGVFATEIINPKEDIGVAIPLLQETDDHKLFQRNTFGLLVNDSDTPNAKCIKIGNDWHFICTKPINKDEEIVVKYDDYLKTLDIESIMTGKRISVI